MNPLAPAAFPEQVKSMKVSVKDFLLRSRQVQAGGKGSNVSPHHHGSRIDPGGQSQSHTSRDMFFLGEVCDSVVSGENQ